MVWMGRKDGLEGADAVVGAMEMEGEERSNRVNIHPLVRVSRQLQLNFS
jgi:hypothetical protein